MTNFRIPTLHAALATALVSFAGCGSMPSAPMLDDHARMDQTAAPQSSTMPIDTPADTGPGGGGSETPPIVVPGTTDPDARSAEMTSMSGGTVRNGRWKVVVPGGAFAGSAVVSLSTPDSRAWNCDLDILPADKNHFDVPVLLVADCHTVPPRILAKWVILEYDAESMSWVRVEGSVVDLKKKTVSAPLVHFSTYKVGAPARGPLTP